MDEYRARETRRAEAKEEKKEDDKDEKKKESGGFLSYLPSLPGFGQEEKKESSSPKSPRSPAPVSPVNVPSSPAPPAHRKFALHRAIFSSRQAELARKEQAARAKEVSKSGSNACVTDPSQPCRRRRAARSDTRLQHATCPLSVQYKHVDALWYKSDCAVRSC